MSGTVAETALREVRGQVTGGVLVPVMATTTTARTLFNAMIDSHPAAIARATPRRGRPTRRWPLGRDSAK